MNILITNLIGCLLTIMIYLNSGLTNNIGMVNALIFIHIGGLIGATLTNLIKKNKITYNKAIPLILYCGGCVGVFNVLFNTMAFSEIGASLTATIGLLSQSITSIIFDVYGIGGTEKIPFNKKKIFGLIVILAGIIIMGVK